MINKHSRNIKMIETVPKGISELLDKVVFIILPSGIKILIFTLPYFIATKIEAFHNRGKEDFRTSHDIEDVITVLDGHLNFDDLIKAHKNVKDYLKSKFVLFLKENLFLESISCHIEQGPNNTVGAKRILDFLKNFSKA